MSGRESVGRVLVLKAGALVLGLVLADARRITSPVIAFRTYRMDTSGGLQLSNWESIRRKGGPAASGALTFRWIQTFRKRGMLKCNARLVLKFCGSGSE